MEIQNNRQIPKGCPLTTDLWYLFQADESKGEKGEQFVMGTSGYEISSLNVKAGKEYTVKVSTWSKVPPGYKHHFVLSAYTDIYHSAGLVEWL